MNYGELRHTYLQDYIELVRWVWACADSSPQSEKEAREWCARHGLPFEESPERRRRVLSGELLFAL